MIRKSTQRLLFNLSMANKVTQTVHIAYCYYITIKFIPFMWYKCTPTCDTFLSINQSYKRLLIKNEHHTFNPFLGTTSKEDEVFHYSTCFTDTGDSFHT